MFRGRATLYVSGDVDMIDDLTYATNPASLPICQNLLGIVTGGNIWIADNAMNRPRCVNGTGDGNTRFFDDDQDYFLHAVTLVGVRNTNATFGVETLSVGPSTRGDSARRCRPTVRRRRAAASTRRAESSSASSRRRSPAATPASRKTA